MKKPGILTITITAGVLLFACLSPYEGGPADFGESGRENFVKVPAAFQAQEDNWIRFFTNDPRYRGGSGYTLWTLFGSETTFTDRSVIVKKSQGSQIAGYGIIFCHAERQGKEIMLTAMVRNSGDYAIGKVTDGAYEALKTWTSAGTSFDKGSGLPNTIKVEYRGENRYELFINGTSMETFYDADEPYCEGYGRDGYVVVIAPGDLNGSSVEVFFKE
ncbi:MAG: hypothetical protein LBJ31_10025 [Treponema sp.]|jgi:hypothetical protein|nr:hypothetical protein [Treponema sp.]